MYDKLRGLFAQISAVEAQVADEIDRLAGVYNPDAGADDSSDFDEVDEPAFSFDRAENRGEDVKVAVATVNVGAGDFLGQVKDAVAKAGGKLSSVDEAQLKSLAGIIDGLKGKSESEIVSALSARGAVIN